MTDTVEVPEEAFQAAKEAFAKHEAEWRAAWHSAIEDAVTAAARLLRAQWERELREQIAGELDTLPDFPGEDAYAAGVRAGTQRAAAYVRPSGDIAARLARGGVS